MSSQLHCKIYVEQAPINKGIRCKSYRITPHQTEQYTSINFGPRYRACAKKHRLIPSGVQTENVFKKQTKEMANQSIINQ